MVAKIAVIGAGWWGQGWHIPCLYRNPDAKLVAIVDQSERPKSDMDSNLVSLQTLQERYKTQVYHSLQDMLDEWGDRLDGVIVSTPHATHYHVAQMIYAAQDKRTNPKPIHILMEKPMATDMDHARALCDLVQNHPRISFWVNHSANFRPQAVLARQAVKESIGEIRHIMCSMASPVQWVFQNLQNVAWTQPSGTMLGNGFCWGQACHLLGWIYFVCGERLKPQQVFCAMNHEPTTGADMSHSATVLCDDDVVMNVSGTALLPGSQYSSEPIGKQIRIQIYGTSGAILYDGDDSDPTSGRLECRQKDGTRQVLSDSFLFESAKQSEYGAESVVHFVRLCCFGHDNERVSPENCADVSVGFRTIQTIEAMYRSHAVKKMVNVR